MPQVITLLLNNGSVDKSYNPSGVIGGVASYRDLSGGVAEVAPVATLSSKGNGSSQTVRGKLTFPLTTTDEGGRVIIADKVICDFSMRLPVTATAAERDEAQALFSDLLADAAVSSAVDNLDGFY